MSDETLEISGHLNDTLLSMKTKVLPLDAIRPYWRNPRRVPEQAVNDLIESMTLYGYQQPVVVDEDDVIIVGHTRYAALRKMGIQSVMVVVADLPPEKARQYRLIDNKTGELTSWDYSTLVLELREWDEQLLSTFFPEISLDISSDVVAQQTTIDQIALAEEKVHTLPGWEPVDAVELVCPNCFHTFAVRRDSVESLLSPEPEAGGGDD